MADQHRATPEQWQAIESHKVPHFSCLLELRDRIEALENDRRAILGSSSRLRVGLDAAKPAESNHPAEPDSSLVDQVEDALDSAPSDSEAKARVAIREVAAWLRERGWTWPANLLEREAEQ